MHKRKLNSDTILRRLINQILQYLDEMAEERTLSDFSEGGRYAFIECLEIISGWSHFHKYGIEDIEKKYPVK